MFNLQGRETRRGKAARACSFRAVSKRLAQLSILLAD
jgi:hypothetical protein